MAEWRPEIETGEGFIHERIAKALEADIAAGALAPDTRLPTHRRLAELLGVSVGAVTRAYAAVEARGLVKATVGRGSFVAGRAEAERSEPRDEGLFDLERALPPLADAHSLRALGRLRQRADPGGHLSYPPSAGEPGHRRAVARWFAATAGWPDLDWRRLILTAGCQQAFAVALGAACRPGDALIVEAATFTGVKTLANHMNYALVGAAMDAEGLTPDALDEAAQRSGARVAYVQPLQNPTGRVMSLARRHAIAAVARQRDLLLVEDDLYAAYTTELGLPRLAMLAPERVFYASGLSKSLAPAFRVGGCVPPLGGDWFDRTLNALRAIAFCAPTLSAQIATQMIEDGTADDMLAGHRSELAARATLALDILGPAAEPPHVAAPQFVWLPMNELKAERTAAAALREGVGLSPPTAGLAPGASAQGLRVCLGAVAGRAALEEALRRLARVLSDRDERTLGMV